MFIIIVMFYIFIVLLCLIRVYLIISNVRYELLVKQLVMFVQICWYYFLCDIVQKDGGMCGEVLKTIKIKILKIKTKKRTDKSVPKITF